MPVSLYFAEIGITEVFVGQTGRHVNNRKGASQQRQQKEWWSC